MKNIGRSFLSSACALALVANSVVVALAQDKQQEKSAQGQNVERTFVREGRTVTLQTGDGQSVSTNIRVPEGFGGVLVNGAQQGGDNVFQFFSQEMSFDNRLVKGAPFSADIVTETVQTLADGNRIVQRSEGHIYRDSQGRTRNERTFQIGGSSEQKQTINIFDPVAGVSYTLDPETRTARKSGAFSGVAPSQAPPRPAVAALNQSAPAEAPKRITVSVGVLQGSAIKKVQPSYPPVARAAKISGAVQVQILVSETGEVIEANVVSGHPMLRDTAVQAARQWQFKPTELSGKPVKVQGILTFNFTLADEEPGPPAAEARRVAKYATSTEQLGKQTVEGVECDGSRAVTTMPAGAIGNERAIETVNETWYSPELKMMILTKRNDPRFGESTYRVTNISRSEPDAVLFQVPSDYTVKEGGYNLRTFTDGVEIRGREDLKLEEKARKPNNQ